MTISYSNQFSGPKYLEYRAGRSTIIPDPDGSGSAMLVLWLKFLFLLQVVDMTTSFQNGLVLCAIIHRWLLFIYYENAQQNQGTKTSSRGLVLCVPVSVLDPYLLTPDPAKNLTPDPEDPWIRIRIQAIS